MSADLGASGSSHSSKLHTPAPIGAEDPTVVTGPNSPFPVGGDSHAAAPETAEIATSSQVSPTLRRLFDDGESVFGMRIAEFVLEHNIGVGGMGAVFKAHDTRLSRKVALKVLSPRVSTDLKLVRRFHNEARATARLSHDNIARVFSSGETLGVHFIAYELIDGTNLRDLINERTTIKSGETLNYALQIAMALNHTSSRGVVHRDIKPSNIIITKDSRARVVDLGLARRDGDDSVADLTVAGSTLGTFDYISPEQAQDPRKVDVRSDIYSLGCTMFHMLTGQAPYQDGTALQKLLDHKGKDAPAPHEVNRKVPRELSAVVRRMMASEPGERYQTPALLVEDLMAVASQIGLRGVQPDGLVWKTASETRPPFLQANLGWIAMGTLLTLATVFLRFQPQSLETDYRTRQLTIARPTADRPNVATPGATGEKPPLISDDAVDAVAAIAETIGQSTSFLGADDAASDDPPAAMKRAADGLQGLFGSLASAFTSRRAVDTTDNSDRVGARSPSSAGTVAGVGPRITLRSDPERPFDTLQAACWEAKSGDVIVIRPDRSNTPLVEKPIRIIKKNLTIRGEPANGRVPLIRFDVGPKPASDESRMIAVMGGDVTISNLDIQVITREEVGTDRWTMCSIEGAERIRLENVNIEIPNPDNVDTTVFEIRLGEDAALARMQDAPPGEFLIGLTGSFVRGNCRLFQVETALSGTLELDQSMVSVAESLVEVAGTNETLEERDRIELELAHATCVCNGLVRMTNEAPGGPPLQLLPLRVVAEDTILATATEQPLIQMVGPSGPQEFRALLTWIGKSNLYDGFSTLWEIDSRQVALGLEGLDFDEWRNFWDAAPEASEENAVSDVSPWLSLRWQGLRPDELSQSDLELASESETAEAIGTASDGTNLGASPDELRAWPVKP